MAERDDDEDEADDMPRCECCLSVCAPDDLINGLCDMCIDEEDFDEGD